jgi:hypothetical protein
MLICSKFCVTKPMRRLTLLPDLRNNAKLRQLMHAFHLRVSSAIVFMKKGNAAGQVSFIMDESTTILHIPNLARDLMFAVTCHYFQRLLQQIVRSI